MPKRALPSLTSLRAFESFARLGAMTLAAEELCVTHGAVSRQVRHLEDSLGIALTEGPRHRLKLTEAGLTLSRTLSGAFDRIGATIHDLSRAALDEIHLSCVGTLAIRWLIPALPDFHEQYPNLRVRVDGVLRAGGFHPRSFRRRHQDRRGGAGGGADATAFLNNFHGPVLAARLKGEGPTGLEGLPRLTTGTRQSAWSEWEAHAGITLPPAQEEQEFEHIFYVLEAAAAGLGVGLSPWIYVARDMADGRLAAPWDLSRPPRGSRLLTPPGRSNPAVETFRQWLIETAAGAAPATGPVRNLVKTTVFGVSRLTARIEPPPFDRV